MASQLLPPIKFWNALIANDRQIFGVAEYCSVTIQIVETRISAGTAPKFVIERSIDGVNWVDVVPAQKLSAGAISLPIDTRATPYLSVRLDFTGATVTTYLVDVFVCGDKYTA